MIRIPSSTEERERRTHVARIHTHTDKIIDYKIRRKFEKDNERRAAGSHVWPWQATAKDDKFMDKVILS